MDNENKNNLTNNGAVPIWKNPLADYDGNPVPHTEDDATHTFEMEEKLEYAQARYYDPTLLYDNITEDELLELIWYGKEDDDNEKR